MHNPSHPESVRSTIDRDLIRQAHHFINGANAHDVRTWIYCYELSAPGSPRQRKYEALLRGFVARKHASSALKSRIELEKTLLADEEASKRPDR